MNAPLALILDIDWAPDFVIDLVAERLIRFNVPATWFVTHDCPAVDRLRERADLFELGIHPNFFQGSSHGQCDEEVIRHCMSLVPDARCTRSHGLYQSSRLFDTLLRCAPIKADLSTVLFRAKTSPLSRYYAEGRELTRFVVIWEDDMELRQPLPNWDIQSLTVDEGPCIVAFHPMLIALNASTEAPYQHLKERCPEMGQVSKALVGELMESGEGVGRMFDQLLRHLSTTSIGCRVSNLLEIG